MYVFFGKKKVYFCVFYALEGHVWHFFGGAEPSPKYEIWPFVTHCTTKLGETPYYALPNHIPAVILTTQTLIIRTAA